MESYQFLWGRNIELRADNFYERIIKAKNINDACEKFIKNKPKSLVWVDYEVKCKGEFIDIRDIEIMQEYL